MHGRRGLADSSLETSYGDNHFRLLDYLRTRLVDCSFAKNLRLCSLFQDRFSSLTIFFIFNLLADLEEIPCPRILSKQHFVQR